ncbi:MAG: family 16 glycosylhydrolase, partial [Planctomycetia bacterium]|nr:family 16 glycosylhydrolase [Planctomycetia bacterium]
ADIRVHEPEAKEIAFVLDQDWEGNGCGFMTIVYDEQIKKYRMYYKAWNIGIVSTKRFSLVRIGLLESNDGIHWTRPNLGLCEYNGSKENNLVLIAAGDGGNCHDFNPFIDRSPNAKPEGRYKSTGAGGNWPDHFGLWTYQSPDGLHWTPLVKSRIRDLPGAFDSQNVSFWSDREQKYVLYYRVFVGVTRSFRKAVSDDFIHWKDAGLAMYPKGEGPIPRAQFYVNQIQPYYRAPQIYLGFPTRYVDNGQTESMKLLPEWEQRERRLRKVERYGTAVSDTVFITSRDGIHFRQSNDVFLRPGARTKDTWTYGDHFLAYPVIETASTEEGMPRELSLYATESYFTGTDTVFRRYTLRLDGFASIHAPTKPGTVTTKAFTFTGKELSLNYRTSGAGLLSVEICTPDGKPIPGYSKADCDPIYGDSLDRRVGWKGNKDISSLQNQPIVLKFYLQECDVYSLKFEEKSLPPIPVNPPFDPRKPQPEAKPLPGAAPVNATTSKTAAKKKKIDISLQSPSDLQMVNAESNPALSPFGQRKLVWADEFDYPDTQLDRFWESENGPSYHIVCSRWRDNIEVKDGICSLINKKEKRAGQDWTSASMHSHRKFLYGYFECRYKYAAATGTNNSFWLMTTGKVQSDNPANRKFEIDINEGHYPDEINTNIHNHQDQTIVKGVKRHPHSLKKFVPEGSPKLAQEYHVYGLLWTKDELVFYFDGKELRREKNDWCHSEAPIYLSEAIFKYAGEITDAIDKTRMQIDYVRVYQ